MSSDRPSPIVAPNAGRRRSGCFNWFRRVPRRPSRKGRRSISNRSSRKRPRCPAIRPNPSILSSRPLSSLILLRNLNNRDSSKVIRSTSSLQHRKRPRDPNTPRHRPIPRPPATERRQGAIQRNRPDMAASVLGEFSEHPACRNPSRRRAPPLNIPASRAIRADLSNLSNLNSRSNPNSPTTQRPGRAVRPIRPRAFLPNNPRLLRPVIRPTLRSLRNNPTRPIHNREPLTKGPLRRTRRRASSRRRSSLRPVIPFSPFRSSNPRLKHRRLNRPRHRVRLHNNRPPRSRAV